eukprot:gene11749-biopygen18426
MWGLHFRQRPRSLTRENKGAPVLFPPPPSLAHSSPLPRLPRKSQRVRRRFFGFQRRDPAKLNSPLPLDNPSHPQLRKTASKFRAASCKAAFASPRSQSQGRDDAPRARRAPGTRSPPFCTTEGALRRQAVVRRDDPTTPIAGKCDKNSPDQSRPSSGAPAPEGKTGCPRPVRVRFFECYRTARVRPAPVFISPSPELLLE